MDRRAVCRYRLYAVLVHCGGSVQSGHYNAFVRVGEHWRCFDDSLVQPVSTNQVFAINHEGNDWPGGRNRSQSEWVRLVWYNLLAVVNPSYFTSLHTLRFCIKRQALSLTSLVNAAIALSTTGDEYEYCGVFYFERFSVRQLYSFGIVLLLLFCCYCCGGAFLLCVAGAGQQPLHALLPPAAPVPCGALHPVAQRNHHHDPV